MSAALTAPVLDTPRHAEKPSGYHRVVLKKTGVVEIVAAYWDAGVESRLHGHDGSSALYQVQSGLVEDEHYLPEGAGYRYERLQLRAGEQIHLVPGSFHRIRALEPSVTVHTYWPPPQDPVANIPVATRVKLEQARQAADEERNSIPAFNHADENLQCRPARRSKSHPNLTKVLADLTPGWAKREAEASLADQTRLPTETLTEMRQSGILAAPIPEHLGGWNASLADTATAVRLLAREAPATALALVMALGNASTTRIPHTAVPADQLDELLQGQHWLAAEVCKGRILAVANSEPGAGGELKNTRTVARLGADGRYYLTGRKSFATFGPDADYFLCAARRSNPNGGADAIDGFFVARDALGVVLDDCWHPAGLKPTASVGLTLDDSPAAAFLGYPGCLEGVNSRYWSTVLFAAVFVGVGERSLREAIGHVAPDTVWARGSLAERSLELDAAAGFVEAVATQELYPLPRDLRERTNRAKTFAARIALETALQAAMVAGGRAYNPDHPVFRCLCDALAGPLLRPPLPAAMDAIVHQLFPPQRG